ncbi:MAG: NYN domain-containing protein [Deltaproteobacteria bacterium]|nr:NYN domain-containing protein [Deltaproteobacteria bacterium]
MENNLAVLVDFENIATGTDKEGLGRFDITAVFRRLKDKGRIVVARAYGDWGRFSRFKSTLLEEGITMVELTSHGMQDKNRADIALCVDAMELAFTRAHVDTFVVLSGDSDFTPLILRLKEFNKRVIGVGTRGSTSKLLVGACDEFIYYNSLLLKAPAARKPAGQPAKEGEPGVDPALTRDEAFALLEEALAGLQRDDPEPALASVVKAAMHRKDPSFNEGELGFRGFGRFLEAAHTAGVVAIRRDERSGGYLVEPAGEGGRAMPPAPPPRRAPAWVAEDSLSPAARELGTLLSGEGLNPLTRAARRDLVEQVVELAADRRGRRRRLNLQALRSELVKRARQDGPLSADAIRAGLRALREAGVFKHADGKPIRTDTAAFSLQPTDPEALLDVMDQAYIRAVVALNLEHLDTTALAELLKGDPAQQLAVEETLAWVALEHEVPDEPDNVAAEEAEGGEE